MDEMFDLVIFDEASQCYAERGIPAMYRGKQIVVAGDDKQLKPFELYQARWEEESADPDSEVDSLLELTKRYLPTTLLQGHYRSKSDQLIGFSNQHFYENKLMLLPDFSFNMQESYIKYIKVDGIWEDQMNKVEAETIVGLIKEILKQTPGKEIGVVTFNAPQQSLILYLLDEAIATEGMTVPEGLFVKNIENVQGDEKEVNIFSIYYARDPDAKMNLQFGSLNVQGGENRLNVAVTRAREKVIVVASIWPEELKVQNVKNEGPKLLRKYLEYARNISDGVGQILTPEERKLPGDWYLSKWVSQWGKTNYPHYTFVKNVIPYARTVVRSANVKVVIIITYY
jgi:superfamily I DNA and/or RNA helicase